jgi:predicted  nucleic acid-binding Zn-ribbon protein
MPELKIVSPKGLGWGTLKQITVEKIKRHIEEQLAPIKAQLNKLEADHDSLEKTFYKTERRLDSRDMASQKNIDILRERNEDLKKEAEKLSSGLLATENLANRAVKGVEENLRAIGKSIETRNQKLVELEAGVKVYVNNSVGPLYAQGKTINAKVDDMVKQLVKFPILLSEFKKETFKKQKEYSDQLSDFSNTIVGVQAKQSQAINDLNNISADFSNHVGDFKSQVKSVEKLRGDYDHYLEQHKQVHSKQDADFKNSKMMLNKHVANFDNHIIDYSMHRKSKAVKRAEAQATLKRGAFARFFRLRG